MGLRKLLENLNIIQALPDKPTNTATELKQQFDLSGNKIKTYINETLTEDLDSALSTINTTLSSKANSSDVYTKTETNALVKGNVLWTGSWFMNQNQEAILSENISDQNNGIILIWSPYQNGQTQNWGFVHTFISKYQLQFSESGVNCPIIHNDFSIIACKYVYIADNVISGSSVNTSGGTGSGIRYNNNAYVLRAVVGI